VSTVQFCPGPPWISPQEIFCTNCALMGAVGAIRLT